MKTMDDLRNELFETIAAVRNGKCDVATARAVADLSQTVINSARAEADFARATGRSVISGLIQQDQSATQPAASLPSGDVSLTDEGKTPDTMRRTTATGVLEHAGNVTRHRLR